MGTAEIAIILIVIVLPISAIYDLMNQHLSSVKNNKTIWALIILLLPLVGPFIYLVVTRYLQLTKK